MKLKAKDCSLLDPQPKSPVEVEWLRKVLEVRANRLVVPIAGYRDEDEPIVYCGPDGMWRAGRYVGSLLYGGSSLTITPRFGLDILRSWLTQVTSAVFIDSPGSLREDESFVVQLLAAVWVHGLVEAARHGLPSLRRDVESRGLAIRGRLDVAASIQLIASGNRQMISVRSERSLDHDVSAAIVAGYVALRRLLPDEKWMLPRTKELMPHFLAVIGSRPSVPTKGELDRVRYTPITAGFKPLAELSRRIAHQRGLSVDIESDGQVKGMLLDVAELWELYVLSVLKRAASPMSVSHGTLDSDASKRLLESDVTGELMGTLKPDAIIYADEDICGIVDAKYKRLHPTLNAPKGPQREDLYQMAAYLARFTSRKRQSAWGLFAYPHDPAEALPPAETNSPWSLDGDKKIIFTTLPHDAETAVEKLRNLISKNI